VGLRLFPGRPAPLVPMESLPASHMLLLETAQKQISEELAELFKPPGGAPREDLAEQHLEDDKNRSFLEWLEGLLQDDEPLEEIRERFEHGKSSGKFPLLSRYLDQLAFTL
jgi:hypothetical protein